MRSRYSRVLVITLWAWATLGTIDESIAQQKAPVPDEAALLASQKAAGELFGSRFRSAKTAAEKTTVVAEMIDAALKLQDGSADQYALLKIAREVAAGAGDAVSALQAAHEQAERFELPAAKLEAETLLIAAREATMTIQHNAIVEAALQLVGILKDAEEIELALRVCDAGQLAAQKSRQFALVKEMAAKTDDLKKHLESLQGYHQALTVLENDPTEPAANLAVGRYLCFVKSNWEQGVAMLTRGNDAALKAVAIKELRGATSAQEQTAIGDAWWDLAEINQGPEHTALRLRAGFWYQQAAPTLAGSLAGLKVKQRLEELSKAGGDVPSVSRADAASQRASMSKIGRVPGGAVLLLDFEKRNFFEEGNATYVADLSGAGNHGRIEGGEHTPDGRAGSGLICRRGGVRLPRAILNGQAEYTFTAWIKTLPPQTSEGWTRIYFEYDSSLCGGIAFDVRGVLRVAAANSGRWQDPHADSPPGSVQFDRWVFVAVALRKGRVGGGNVEITIDDKRYQRVSQIIGGNPNAVWLGDRSLPINGVLDEVAAYHRVLTEDEIQALYWMGRRGQSLTQP